MTAPRASAFESPAPAKPAAPPPGAASGPQPPTSARGARARRGAKTKGARYASAKQAAPRTSGASTAPPPANEGPAATPRNEAEDAVRAGQERARGARGGARAAAAPAPAGEQPAVQRAKPGRKPSPLKIRQMSVQVYEAHMPLLDHLADELAEKLRQAPNRSELLRSILDGLFEAIEEHGLPGEAKQGYQQLRAFVAQAIGAAAQAGAETNVPRAGKRR